MAMNQFVLECEERAVAGQSTDEIAHAMGVTKDLVNTALNGVTERENGVDPIGAVELMSIPVLNK